MSRSGYNDDWNDDDRANWRMIRYRGAVTSAFRGKRGQAFLKEMQAALEGLPNKRLIANNLMHGGEVCALGAVGVARRKDMRGLKYHDQDECEAAEEIAYFFGIANSMAREIMYENDEMGYKTTPEQRYNRMLRWVESQIK